MLVLHLNHSPLTTGLVAFAAIAPSMLIYIPAGVLVDRWNPRRVMLVSEVLRGIAIASVVILLKMYGRQTSVVFLIAAMVAEEVFEIFSTLADRRYLSRLMERDRIESSQAYIEVRAHAAVLAGRPVGPFLFSLKPLAPFLADAVSFAASVASLVFLRGYGEPSRELAWHGEKVSARQLMADFREGFRWLRKDRRAASTVTLMSITSLIAQALIMMFLAEAHAKEFSTMAIGIVLAASGVGGALGSIFTRFIPKAVRKYWMVIQMAAWCVALAFLAMAGGLSVWLSAVAMSILGFTGAIGNIVFATYLVTNAAENMLARVTSIGQVLAIGACALGPVLGGAAIQSYGPQGAIVVLLVIVTVMAITSLTAVWLGRGLIQRFLSAVTSVVKDLVAHGKRLADARTARNAEDGDSADDGTPPPAGTAQAESADLVDGRQISSGIK
jgi:predicted MFS family arabinose efflux permease